MALAAPLAGEPAEAAASHYTAANFFRTTDYVVAESDRAFAPDGKTMLLTANSTGIFNVFSLDLESGEQRQLTRSTTDATYAIGWFRDGRRFLFTADRGGNELNHIFVSDNGKARDLTPGKDLRAMFIGWDDDDDSFVIATNERDERVFDLYRYDAQSYRRKLVFRNDLALEWMILSHDGAHAAGIRPYNSGNRDVYLMDLENGAPAKLITPEPGNVDHVLFSFTPNSKKLLLTTDAFGEFSEVYSYDIATGGQERIAARGWDILKYAVSPDGAYSFLAANEDSSTGAYFYRHGNTRPLAFEGRLPRGDLQGIRFAPDGRRAVVFMDSDRSPTDAYLVDLATRRIRQLTHGLNPAIDPADLVDGEVVSFASFDGLDIPAVLYRPKGVGAGKPVPAMIYSHGGPWGQNTRNYNPVIQLLVNHGYAVLAVNNRGSIGYGKTFFHLDDRRHGDVDLKDMIAAKRYLAASGWVEPDKIGIMGASYGGYMTMAAMTFAPEEFAVGIDIFGVTNWVRTIESIPTYWESFRESFLAEVGDPATDGERHRRISPLFHASNITKPVLVVQGANDPRVIQAESDDIVAALNANHVPVEYLLFPDEGHDFKSRKNRIAAAQAYLDFLHTYLKP